MDLNKLNALLQGATMDGCDCHTASIELGNGNAIEVETAIFLYGFVRRYHPAVIVETGTHFGYSSAAIASALVDAAEDYPQQLGHLWTVDTDAYEGKPEKLWDSIGVSHAITHYVEDSRYVAAEKIPPMISLLWLDADHSAEAIIAEFENYSPFLDPNGYIVTFHDSRLDKRLDPGIEEIKRIIRSRGQKPEHIAMRNFRGFDMIQVRP